MVETKRLVKFRHGFGAPVTGITPSTQVGRLSGSHSDIGFQLAVSSIPRSKMVRERRGEKVSSLERLNKLFVRDCRAQR